MVMDLVEYTISNAVTVAPWAAQIKAEGYLWPQPKSKTFLPSSPANPKSLKISNGFSNTL